MAVSYLLLCAWATVVLFPLYWLAITSLKTPIEVNGGPFFIPFRDFQPTLDSWHYIFFDLRDDTFRPYLNTVVVGLSSTSFTILLGSMAAYGLVRMRYQVRLGAVASFVAGLAVAVAAIVAGAPGLLGGAAGLALFALLAQTVARRFKRALRPARRRLVPGRSPCGKTRRPGHPRRRSARKPVPPCAAGRDRLRRAGG